MSGKYKGLQARIREINPLAVWVPCGTHKLNLTVCHAADSSTVVVRFFMFVQNIYVFFSDSTKRWELLIKHLKSDLLKRDIKGERLLVPKKLSDTRWSERADACRALKAGFGSFISALVEICENAEEKMEYRIEARSLRDELYKLETATLVEFWASVLDRVNNTSKSLQRPSIDIKTSISLQKSLINFFTKLRNEETADEFVQRGETLIKENVYRSEMDNNFEVKFNCYDKKTRKRNTRYDIGEGPDTVFSDHDDFRVNVLFSSLDLILTELRATSDAFEENMSPFVFLTQLEYEKLTNADLRNQAETLRKKYSTDLDEGLYDECLQFKPFMEDINAEMEKDMKALKEKYKDDDDDENLKSKMISKTGRMLQYIIKANIQAAFPNINVALRILESIPSCNASGERSFSSLKRVKGPLRFTQTQQNLNDLAMLFINNDIFKEIDLDQIIATFASSKASLVRM